jgi:hypothetical protein
MLLMGPADEVGKIALASGRLFGVERSLGERVL